MASPEMDLDHWDYLPGANIRDVRHLRVLMLEAVIFIFAAAMALVTWDLMWLGLSALIGLGLLLYFFMFVHRPTVATGMVRGYEVPIVSLSAAVDKVLDDEGVRDRIYTKVLDFNDTRGNTAFVVDNDTSIFLMQYEPWTMVHIGPMRLSKRELIERLTRLVDRSAMIARAVKPDQYQARPLD